MRESGWYPPGAEHDPRAPWNETDEDEIDEYDPWEDFTGHEDDLDLGRDEG